MATATNPITLEWLWNSYAILEEDDPSKKIWLDVFLCHIKRDPFLASNLARKIVAPRLIAELKKEIGFFCGPNLAAEDLEQLKRYFNHEKEYLTDHLINFKFDTLSNQDVYQVDTHTYIYTFS